MSELGRVMIAAVEAERAPLLSTIADLERQLAEAHRILALDDSRLLTAVENTARALQQRDGAQGKLDAVERYAARLGGGHSLCTWQGLVKSDLDRILSKEGE